MSEENKTNFGNMPLGMINKMLVDFIGEDAFLDYCEKHHKDWKLDWQSKEAFSKHLSYRDLNPNYDQSVYRTAFKILDDFCEQYGLSPYIFNILAKIGCNLIARLGRQDTPVFETYFILLYEICQNVLPTLLEKAVNEIGKNNGFSYFDAKTKYNMVFDELGRQFNSLENFYHKLSEYYWDSPTQTWYKEWYKGLYKKKGGQTEEEKQKKEGRKTSYSLYRRFRDLVIYNYKKGQNPAKWNDMKAILDFCKKEKKNVEVSHLIEAYITVNVQNFIKAEIPDSTLQKIKDCLKKIGDLFDKSVADGEKDLQNLYDSADKLLYEMEPTIFTNLNLSEDNFKPIDSTLREVLKNHVYLQDEKRTEYLISNIKEISLEASGFYCNWLHAYIEVAKGEFESAKKLYKAAFDNIHFAGIYATPFLKQAFILSVYCDSNRDTIRKAIDPKKPSKTPLSPDGKRFWEYGYAIGIFDKPVEETYRELVFWREKFSDAFPEDMFFPDIEVNLNRKLAPTGCSGFYEGNIKEKIEEYYNNLSALKEGSINTPLKIFDGDLQRRPPLSVAMWLFSISSNEGFIDLEERFLDLIERWLGLSDPETAIKELNFNVIADLGETPLNTATMVYKDFCEKNSDPKSPVKEKLKKIITHILWKTDKDYLKIATGKNGIHALQNVIDLCDIDLVKEFAKKFVEVRLDINSIRFTPDKIPSLNYTIGHISQAMFDESTSGEQIEKLKEICLYIMAKGKKEEYVKLFESYGLDFTFVLADKSKEKPQ